MNRDHLALMSMAFVAMVCVSVRYGCGAASEHCRSTWLRDVDPELHYGMFGNNVTRGCFDYALRGQTALGDTVLSVSSLFLCTCAVYTCERNAVFVLTCMCVAAASFLLHATYGATVRVYDIVGTRTVATGFAVDALFVALAPGTLPRQRAVAACTRLLMVVGAAYITWNLYHLNNPHQQIYVSRHYTLVWISVPAAVGVLGIGAVRQSPAWYACRGQGLRLLGIVVAMAVGGVFLVESGDPCHPTTQFYGAHVYGHILVGIALALVASLAVWQSPVSPPSTIVVRVTTLV